MNLSFLEKPVEPCRRFANWLNGIPAILTLMLVHLLLLWVFFEPAISTPDANGYMAQARLIAENGRSDIVVENPAQYVGDHWMKVTDGHFFGQYPPGLPAVLAVVYRYVSPIASLWVIPVMATLSLLALFLVVRQWIGAAWGVLAAVLMLVNPYANAHALGADSHTAVCFFLLWGLYGLVRWEKTKSAGWAILTGLCLGMIPTIRYAEALFLFAAAGFVAMNWRPADGFRSLIAGVMAAGVPMTALAVRNQNAFGAFWKTGYSVSGEQTGFALSYFLRFTIPYLLMIFAIGSFAVFVVGVRGIVTLCRHPETRRRGVLLMMLTLPISLLYCAYYFPANPKSMRFFLPTFYIYAIAAVYFIAERMATDAPRATRLAKRLFLLNLIWGIPLTYLELASLKRDNRELAKITRELQSHVTPGSILVAQSGVLQHLDFVGGWQLAPEESFYRQARSNRPLGPETFGSGFAPMFGFDDPNDDRTPESRSQEFRKNLIDWSGTSRKIYVLASQNQLDSIEKQFGENDQFRQISVVQVSGGDRGRRGGPPRFDGPDKHGEERPPGPPGGFFFRLFGPPMPPPGMGPHGDGPGGRRKGRRGPGGGFGGPPGRFHPPQDGKLLLVEWQINAKPASL